MSSAWLSRLVKIEREKGIAIKSIAEISFVYPETWRMLLSTGSFYLAVRHTRRKISCES